MIMVEFRMSSQIFQNLILTSTTCYLVDFDLIIYNIIHCTKHYTWLSFMPANVGKILLQIKTLKLGKKMYPAQNQQGSK